MYSLISRIDRSSTPRPSKPIDLIIVFVFFILGMWLIVLRPLGLHLQLVPGDLGDARFNNYILEHFFRFISGATKDYWNAPFFFPYQQTTAFSDTLLGSAPIYVLFRLIGLGRVSAFQGWYILAFVLDFTSASFILRRLKLATSGDRNRSLLFYLRAPLIGSGKSCPITLLLLHTPCLLCALEVLSVSSPENPAYPGCLASLAGLLVYLHRHLPVLSARDPFHINPTVRGQAFYRAAPSMLATAVDQGLV